MKVTLALLAAPLAVIAAAVDPVTTPAPADTPAVFTVEQVHMTIVDVEPFMVEVTETVVWTQSPSITPASPTAAPKPTLDPAYDV
ncbi:hypothetical protein BJ165DRAFT_1531912 [Panaeolus papilionaceus]|nr:hypothetical protein BJ165DRAFT_1531912 [Panaeolus papilionaceus]